MRNLLKCQKGQGAIEYTLIAAAILGIVILTFAAPNNQLSAAVVGTYHRMTDAIGGALPAP